MRYSSHAVCDVCYTELEPSREPHRMTLEHTVMENCCRCARPTLSGIYYREAMDAMPCCRCAA